jgi:hypothetical protein
MKTATATAESSMVRGALLTAPLDLYRPCRGEARSVRVAIDQGDFLAGVKAGINNTHLHLDAAFDNED